MMAKRKAAARAATKEDVPFHAPAWPATKPELWKLEKIIPYPNNPRSHPPAQVTLLAELMKKRGVDQPIVVDDAGVILKGHGRRLAAIEAGFEEFPVVVHRGLSDTDKSAMRIEDNQISLLSGWDAGLLRAELSNLSHQGYELSALGFENAQLVSFMAMPPSDQDPEAEVEPPKKPVSKPGDLWVLGRHRILCGDSTNAVDVERALDGSKPKLMPTDPPYGVDYDANWRNEADRANGKAYGASAVSPVENDHKNDWTEAWKLFRGDVVYCWHAGRHASAVQSSLEAAGFEIVCQIIWAKTRLIISRGDYHWQHEPCWYAVRKGKRHNWAGDRSQTTLWTIEHAKSETGHSTQKPIECMRRPILNNSKPGDVVYEPFSGSGTTIIACEMENRACRAIELSPAYVDVAVKRWQDFTKSKAVLAGENMTFAEVAKKRGIKLDNSQ